MKRWSIVGLCLLIGAAGFAGGYWLGRSPPERPATTPYVTLEMEALPAENEWNEEIMSGFGTVRLRQPGFVYRDVRKKWNLVIRNLGEQPAHDIRIRYSLVAYKHEIDTGLDQADVRGYHPVVYARDTRTLRIDSLPAGESASRTVFYLSRFPRAECYVESFHSGNHVLIPERTLLKEYRHPEFERLEDAPHLRKMLGLTDDWQ